MSEILKSEALVSPGTFIGRPLPNMIARLAFLLAPCYKFTDYENGNEVQEKNTEVLLIFPRELKEKKRVG